MSRQVSGIACALGSAAAFSFAGTVGSGLMTSGWSAGAAVCGRILLGALVLLPPCLVSMRGRWGLVPGAALRVALYGLLAIAGAQLAYFQAVRYLPVSVALLVEFTAPVAVLLWLWATGGQRPSRTTAVGATIAVIGLIIVLDLVSGVEVNVVGIAWSLGAMVGLSAFFLLSSDDSHGLPPIAFATGGLFIGGAALALAGTVGILDIRVSAAAAVFAGREVPWWVALGVLGVMSGGAAYLLGVEAARRLGSRLASFVGLTEVLLAALVAWLLLGEVPTALGALGAVLVLLGVVLVKLGESEIDQEHDVVEVPAAVPTIVDECTDHPDEMSQ